MEPKAYVSPHPVPTAQQRKQVAKHLVASASLCDLQSDIFKQLSEQRQQLSKQISESRLRIIKKEAQLHFKTPFDQRKKKKLFYKERAVDIRKNAVLEVQAAALKPSKPSKSRN